MKEYAYPQPAEVEPSALYKKLCNKSTLLESNGFHRRAASLWQSALNDGSMNEEERELCISNVNACIRRGKITTSGEGY